MTAEAGSPITTYFRVCDGVRVRFAESGVPGASANGDLEVSSLRRRAPSSVTLVYRGQRSADREVDAPRPDRRERANLRIERAW
jgi:hypothetical protein